MRTARGKLASQKAKGKLTHDHLTRAASQMRALPALRRLVEDVRSKLARRGGPSRWLPRITPPEGDPTREGSSGRMRGSGEVIRGRETIASKHVLPANSSGEPAAVWTCFEACFV